MKCVGTVKKAAFSSLLFENRVFFIVEVCLASFLHGKFQLSSNGLRYHLLSTNCLCKLNISVVNKRYYVPNIQPFFIVVIPYFHTRSMYTMYSLDKLQIYRSQHKFVEGDAIILRVFMYISFSIVSIVTVSISIVAA